MLISDYDLQAVKDLRQKNLSIQAFKLAKSICPLEEWEGSGSILEASHLVYDLGAPEKSFRWMAKAWRRDPTNPETIFYRAAEMAHRRGPLPALKFLRKITDFDADDRLMGWWYSLHAQVYSQLRDFSTADMWHKKAFALTSPDSWVWVAKGYTLELQDRYEESLEANREGLKLTPDRYSCLIATAHSLTLLEEYSEALELLSAASDRMENGWVTKQLAEMQTELGLHESAYGSLDRVLELFPMIEEKVGDWVFGSLSDAAYMTGDIVRSKEFAGRTSNVFHAKIKKNLEENNDKDRRVRLDVGFLRQHFVTCAPATLANLARFWKKQAEHLTLVKEMCYDGTAGYKERIWAEANGWETREFTFNWNNVTEILDRGVPLTLATVQPGNGHLQAIIGYDERRRTVLIRDPYYQRTGEFLADDLVEQQRSSGPRVMALVPVEKADLLLDLQHELKDSAAYDLHFKVESSLHIHDRATALLAIEKMEEEWSDHRLTWGAKWTLAGYDGNRLAMLEAAENLQRLFPDDISLKLSNLSISYEFTGRKERLAALEMHARSRETDPLIWQMFAYELGLDANQHGRALHWHKRTLRRLSTDSRTFKFIADILWARRSFDESSDLYRFATCLDDKNEQFAYSYFLAMRHRSREEEALEMLRDRFDRFGERSSQPIQSLFHSLRELGRSAEAVKLLDAAMEKRPVDGDLKLFAANALARLGEKTRAEKLLAAARNEVSEASWLRKAALMSEMSGDLKTSLEHWKVVSSIEPYAVDVHESVAYLLSAKDGKQAAQDYLRKVTREFRSSRNLLALRLSYLEEETTEAIAVLRDIVRLDPRDAWAQRELARWLCRVRKFDKALAAAESATEIDPNDPLNRSALGMVYSQTDRAAEGAEEFERAIRLSVDADYAIRQWIGCLVRRESKVAALRIISEELRKQVNFGPGIFAYREEAKRIFEPSELFTDLKEFFDGNRRSWFAWSVLIQQLVDMHGLDEALEYAEEAVEKFPLISELWYDLSLIFKVRGDAGREIDALSRAVSINPSWSVGTQQLIDALERAGRLEEAKTTVLEAIGRLPLDPYLRGYLSEIYWRLGEKGLAVETVRFALTLETNYAWAWSVLKDWSAELGQPDLPQQLAHELTERKPNDVKAWINYAQILEGPRFCNERLAAIEQALKIDAQNQLAIAIKANTLADMRRFDEGIAICRATMVDGVRPERLQFTESGIEASRGNFDRAIDILEELTVSSPEYIPAWQRLADIYRNESAKKREYLRTTRALTRLLPLDATSFGYLGDACLLNNDRPEAKEALRQAYVLDPLYSYAGCKLFDLHLEDDEKEECNSILERLREFLNDESSLAREIAMCAKLGDIVGLKRLLANFVLKERATRTHYDYIFKKTKEFSVESSIINSTLLEAAGNVAANPLVGAYLIERRWPKEREKGSLKILSTLEHNKGVWTEGAISLMEAVRPDSESSIRKFIDANRTLLSSTTEGWANAGYQLIRINDFDKAVDWFSDWRDRLNVMPWMLWNYSIALLRSGRSNDTKNVNSAALELAPDDTTDLHLNWLGLSEYLNGNFEQAAQLLSTINPSRMTDWDQFFYQLLKAGVEIRQIASFDNEREVNRQIKKAVLDPLKRDPLLKDRVKRDRLFRASRIMLDSSRSKWLKFQVAVRLFLVRIGLRV